MIEEKNIMLNAIANICAAATIAWLTGANRKTKIKVKKKKVIK